MQDKSSFFLQNVCGIPKKVILLQAIKQNDRTMLNRNAYFYGYYFYFAGTCEAESRM
jgi:hypothetical protein